MEQEYYWLWLSRIRRLGRRKIEFLLHSFQSPERVWNGSKKQLLNISGLTLEDVATIEKSKDKSKIMKWMTELEEKKIQFITMENDVYPPLLKNIYDPPLVLYIKGNLPRNNGMIGIVGARGCSEYGRQTAKLFGRQLAKKDIIVVSGMARGVDTAAHRGALEGGGKTIAVLGNGVDICYPPENWELMEKICENGAVISEFPPGTGPRPGFFPMRNRVISGMSKGILVVEAAKRSGSLITADQALEQGREVYAVPGNIISKLSEGTNGLIKQGAKLVTSASDILEDLNIHSESSSTSPKKQKENLDGLETDEKIVYDCLSLEPIQIDELARKVEFPIHILQHILMILELKGYVKQLPSKRFIRNL